MMIDWWQSSLGQHIASEERLVLSFYTQYFYGNYQIQIGMTTPLLPKLSENHIQKIMSSWGDFEGEPEALPFKSRSINTLLLAHVLEFSDDPHQVLREVERVLELDGILVLYAFNPWSLWGLRRLFSWRSTPPWQGCFFGKKRIKDWLSLLNFDAIETQALLSQPPIKNEIWFKRFRFMEQWGQKCGGLFAGVTLIIAQKQTIPLTPIKQGWRTNRLFTPKLNPQSISRDMLNEKS